MLIYVGNRHPDLRRNLPSSHSLLPLYTFHHIHNQLDQGRMLKLLRKETAFFKITVYSFEKIKHKLRLFLIQMYDTVYQLLPEQPQLLPA